MVKRILIITAVLTSAVLPGCGVTGIIQTVQTINNARSGYQGYEAMSTIKSIKDKTPVFKDYQIAFVSMDVKPQKADAAAVDKAMAETYSRSISDMAKELGLNVVCKPYVQEEVEAAPDALVIQVEEVPVSTATAVMSGENIHGKVRYIDKKSAKLLVEEEYKPLKGYNAMIGIMTSSAMVKMMGNGPAATNGTAAGEAEQKAWADKVSKFANGTSKKYPILTDEEKALLAQG